MPETETPSPVAKATSAAAWKKRAVHDVTLPSGTQVTIRLPNLASMIRGGAIPSDLLDIAIKQQTQEAPTVDDVKEAAKFHQFLVRTMVVKPELSEEDVDEIPSEDFGMLVEFALRQRDTDILGHHLAGLETTEAFQKFRDLEERLASLASLA